MQYTIWPKIRAFIQKSLRFLGDYLYVSVKRQKKGGAKVMFPNMELLEVDVPVSVQSAYALPETFDEEDIRQYPLFDSSGKVNLPVHGSNVNLKGSS